MTFVPQPILEERAEVVASAIRSIVGDEYPVQVEPSPVEMSPYMHVFVYLTGAGGYEGRRIQISHAEEFEDVEGYFVTVREDYEDQVAPDLFPSLQGVKLTVKKLINALDDEAGDMNTSDGLGA